jgi:general secretion pathway protein D
MSLSRRRPAGIILALALLALAGPAAAQTPSTGGDAGDRARRTLDVAARQVEADVKLALKEAVRLAPTDPAKAVEKLQKLLAKLEADHVLPADRRDQLTRVVKDRLLVTQAGQEPAPEPKALPLPAESARQVEELAKVKAGLQEAVALSKQGKAAEANLRLAELTRQYPDNVAVQFLGTIQQTADRRDEARAVRRDVEQRATAALNSVDRAAAVPRDDIEYPKDFKEKTAKRQADTAPTAAELKILRSLESPVDARFKDSRLEDVTDTLATLIGLPIVLDKAALDELQLSYSSPVTFVVRRPVAARTALRGIFRGLGLTYVVREGTVFVTTPTRAREFLVTKAYYLGDLVVPIGYPDPIQEAFNVAATLEMIVTTIDPDSWEQRGGPGTLRYYAPKRAIVVRQSAEIHVMIRGSMPK